MALNGPKYKPRGLQRLLDQYFESDPLLDRALTSIIIPAFDTKLQQPIFFSSWQAQRDPLENPPIKAVCRASSASPTYFPPIHFTLTDTSREPNETREFNLIDGGVVVNNPTYVAITQAIKESQAGGALAERVDNSSYNDILVLSLGTGQHTMGYDARDVAKWGIVDWLANKGEAPLVDMVFNASADMVDYNLSIMFQSQQCASNYLRIQTDNLNGPLASVDDSSESNLWKLMATAKHLLDEPVTVRNFQTGKLHSIPCGGTNREALYRFAEWLSEERKTRLATEPPPAPVELAPPPVVVETPSPPPEAADSPPAEEKPAEQPAEQPAAPEPEEAAPPAASAAPEAKSDALGEDAHVVVKEEKASAYVTFPYVPRAAYFDDPFNTRRVDSSYVPFSDPAYRASHSSPNSSDYSNSSYNSSHNSSYNPTSRNPYSSSSYETSNRVSTYMPSPFEDAYRTPAYSQSSYEPSFSTSYPEQKYQISYSSYSRPSYESSQDDQSNNGSSYGSYSCDSTHDSYSYTPSYAPDTSVTASAYERPSYESTSTSYAATPEPTQYASYGDAHSSSSYSSTSYRDTERFGAGSSAPRGYQDLFGFFA